MNCKQIQEILLTDEADGTLDAQRSRELADHLAGCPACREFKETLTAHVLAPLRSAPRVRPPEFIWDNIKEAISAGRAEEKTEFAERLARLFAPACRPVYAAAFALVLFVAAAVFFGWGTISQTARNFSDEQVRFMAGLTAADNGADDPAEGFGTDIEEFLL